MNGPIIHIVNSIRTYIIENNCFISDNPLREIIEVDWDMVDLSRDESNILKITINRDEENEVLDYFKSLFNVTISICKEDKWEVYFTSTKEYDRFKMYALEQSNKDVIFTADVLDLLSVEFRSDKQVILKPFDSYNIKHTLKKVLEL